MKTYEIIGRKWATECTYFDWDNLHHYPHYEQVDTFQMEKEFEGLHHAYLWMLENIPAYAIGCNIRCKDNGDFLMTCVKDYMVSVYRTDSMEAIVEKEKEYCNNFLNGKVRIIEEED